MGKVKWTLRRQTASLFPVFGECVKKCLRAAAIGGGVSRDCGGVPMCSLTGVKPLSESVITIVKHRDAKSDLLRQLGDLRWLPLPSSQWVRLQCQSAAIRAVRHSGHGWC